MEEDDECERDMDLLAEEGEEWWGEGEDEEGLNSCGCRVERGEGVAWGEELDACRAEAERTEWREEGEEEAALCSSALDEGLRASFGLGALGRKGAEMLAAEDCTRGEVDVGRSRWDLRRAACALRVALMAPWSASVGARLWLPLFSSPSLSFTSSSAMLPSFVSVRLLAMRRMMRMRLVARTSGLNGLASAMGGRLSSDGWDPDRNVTALRLLLRSGGCRRTTHHPPYYHHPAHLHPRQARAADASLSASAGGAPAAPMRG